MKLPILRESIGQYINLIRKLTGKTTNKEMEKSIHKVLLSNYSSSKLVADNFHKAIVVLFKRIIQKLHERINEYLSANNSNWKVYHVGELNKNDDRGNIFLRPKFFNNRRCFGIEEFNPLAKSHHFGHKVFFGMINSFDMETLKKKGIFQIDNEKGGWFNYRFPQSESFDFHQSTETHIPYLLDDIRVNNYVLDIFESFKNFFEENQESYLAYINRSNLNLSNFEENRVENLGSDLDLKDMADFFHSKFNSGTFKNVINKRVWSDWRADNHLFVVDFKEGFRFDFVFNEHFYIELIHLEKSAYQDKILNNFHYKKLENGRIQCRIAGDTIGDVINNLHDFVRQIDMSYNNS